MSSGGDFYRVAANRCGAIGEAGDFGVRAHRKGKSVRRTRGSEAGLGDMWNISSGNVVGGENDMAAVEEDEKPEASDASGVILI